MRNRTLGILLYFAAYAPVWLGLYAVLAFDYPWVGLGLLSAGGLGVGALASYALAVPRLPRQTLPAVEVLPQAEESGAFVGALALSLTLGLLGLPEGILGIGLTGLFCALGAYHLTSAAPGHLTLRLLGYRAYRVRLADGHSLPVRSRADLRPDTPLLVSPAVDVAWPAPQPLTPDRTASPASSSCRAA